MFSRFLGVLALKLLLLGFADQQMLGVDELIELLFAVFAGNSLDLFNLGDLLLFEGLDDGSETFRLRLPSLASLLQLGRAHHLLLLLLLGLLHHIGLNNA